MWAFIISGVIALSMHNGPAANRVNEKAVQHFNRSYKEAMNEQWTTAEDCYRVSFTIGSVKHITDYYLNGRWRNTIRIYDQSHLPAGIRTSVKEEFFNSEIRHVTELRYGSTLAYFIKINHNGWTKTVRITDAEVTVMEAFRDK